ncbi:MAG: hypothetical protein ACJ74Q_15195 [Pyrinomonadaceae bacterium]
MIVEEDGRPVGWQEVRLTEDEREALVEAADSGDCGAAESAVAAAYGRLYAERGGEILESNR